MEAVDEVTDKDGTGREDIEMKERNKKAEEDRRGKSERERERRDRVGESSGMLDMDDSAPKVFTEADVDDTDIDIESRLKKMGKSDGKVRRRMVHNKKQFLMDALGVVSNKGDGPDSTALFDRTNITFADGTKNVDGAMYRGKQILILDTMGRMKYSPLKSMKPYVNEFKELLKRTDIEHKKTAAYVAERRTGVALSEESINGITDNVRAKVGDRIDNKADDIKANIDLTENELREFRGILNVNGNSGVAKIEALEIESKNWRDKAEVEGDTAKGKLYEAIADVADLKADEIRLVLNIKPETEEVTDILEETAEASDMTRFERFKKWSRENLLGISSLAIGVASILTTIFMAIRNAAAAGGSALDKLRKSVTKKIKELAKKIGGNIGPIVSAIGSIISGIIAILAKLLGFLGENLWLLFLAVTYFVYSEYKSRRETSAYSRK